MKRSILFALLVGIFLSSVTTTASAASPFSWTATGADSSNDLLTVSCPSASLCVGGDTGGNVVTSTNPTGGAGAWTVTHVDGGQHLTNVSCSSANLCVADDTGGNVVTSTNPTGGAGAWTVTPVASGLSGVSCPSASLCVIGRTGGDIAISTNPTGGAGAWTIVHVGEFGETIYAVSCPSASLCVAVDSGGNVITSTNPTGGAGAWTLSNVKAVSGPALLGGFRDVSCPSGSLCVATASTAKSSNEPFVDQVVTSTNPTGGAGAWTVSSEFYFGPFKVSCASASLCGTSTNGSGVATSVDPTGGEDAWSVATGFINEQGLPSSPGPFADISCPSASLCLVVDFYGNAVWGVPAVLPVNTSPPKISGVPVVGKTLTCEKGSWSGKPLKFEYRWLRDGVEIPHYYGPPTAYETVRHEDEGHTITCVVIAINDAGKAEAVSAGLAIPGGSSGSSSRPGNGKGPGSKSSGPKASDHCKVPKLKGKKLPKAKKLLARSHCKLGKIKKSKKHHKRWRVIRQGPKAGKILPAGTKISVVLG